MGEEPFDYIVVGSGAGGGTVAARLAEEGMRVLLLEAGGDPRHLKGGARGMGEANRLPDDYDVPAFHPFASENSAMRWDFHVRHYRDEARQALDPKAGPDGVLYPRAGTLGGCTAHNAMIFIAPHADDWQRIADLSGELGWSPDAMDALFRRMEACRYRPVQAFLRRFGLDRTGHGYEGWLPVEKAIPRAARRDRDMKRIVMSAIGEISKESGNFLRDLGNFLESVGDPNDRDWMQSDGSGVCYTPLSTRKAARYGSRERLAEVAQRHSGLRVELDALATRIILDDRNRAVGVEYLKGERLYRASAEPSSSQGKPQYAMARREVIVAGGAFNTPQLLMLSGIGAPEELEQVGIRPRVALDGVGRNLQDRYEVAVVNRMAFDCWESMEGADFRPDDKLWRKWRDSRTGLYTTNGAGLGVICRSSDEAEKPDLFCMALLGRFDGYYPGYAAKLAETRNHLTWAVLKARTANRAGRVTLASADPRDPPRIDFSYFDEGSDGHEADLAAVVEGVKFVRRLAHPMIKRGEIAEEEVPGPAVNTDDEIAEWVRRNAWGHHASCSCPIGPKDGGGVVDGRLRVHGTTGLRVADASVFPRIPGFFIASAVYMVGERAAEMILEDSRAGIRSASSPHSTPEEIGHEQ